MDLVSAKAMRRSLGRGYARQALQAAQDGSADMARLMTDLHGLAPNARSHSRFARRLARRRGVLRAAPSGRGLRVLARCVLDVTVCKDGTACFREARVCWTRIDALARRGRISFTLTGVQVSRHAMQRRAERSDCFLRTLLADMDIQMCAALDHLRRCAPIKDRGDAFLPASDGVWAGGTESMSVPCGWGAAFAGSSPPLNVFAIRTFLGEAEMRPTVWLAWSGTRAAPDRDAPLQPTRSAA
ncbi:hypothetical protein DKT77_08005 [Meridianimarinicoccus roseus]|jgi:hypothetical protein|uniref:Uncharacterized protein n=1 Tax=Meridianimarinicoccus roseus TaxID=2072018 RepID=A0A2V2LC95_9RHOB|nr:hypothetical protein [Meridianimarinicoccus roseus]PWR03150.1 hypothetical protein DKT77_08005 [Meridianimarinicoccus roseus]